MVVGAGSEAALAVPPVAAGADSEAGAAASKAVVVVASVDGEASRVVVVVVGSVVGAGSRAEDLVDPVDLEDGVALEVPGDQGDRLEEVALGASRMEGMGTEAGSEVGAGSGEAFKVGLEAVAVLGETSFSLSVCLKFSRLSRMMC